MSLFTDIQAVQRSTANAREILIPKNGNVDCVGSGGVGVDVVTETLGPNPCRSSADIAYGWQGNASCALEKKDSLEFLYLWNVLELSKAELFLNTVGELASAALTA